MSSQSPRSVGMLLLAVAIPACGQFSQLAATDDGKQLYFTSQSLLKGATQTLQWAEARLYRYGPDGVTLFAERGSLAPRNSGGSSDGVSHPQVSGDGGVVGFTLNNICPTSSDCTQPVQAKGELRGKTTQDLGPGTMQLSRNGRWALLTVTNFDFTANLPTTTQVTVLIDLNTGLRTTVPSSGSSAASQPGYHAVASDGTLLVRQDNILGLWKQGQFTPIQLPTGLAIYPIALSDDASTLFLNAAAGSSGLSGFRLLAMNLASGKLTIVFQQQDSTQVPTFMGASNDGQLVIYRRGGNTTSNGPAFVFNAATGASIPISLPSGELATDGTLTGGGDFAFLATTTGRLVRVTLATGGIEGLFPAPPHCSDLQQSAVPGSFVRLHCNVTGSVSDLQGQILVNDVPMPILYVTASEIGAQVPWGVGSFFGGNLTLKTANSSPFQASQTVNLPQMVPLFEPADPGTSPLLGLKLVKGDWSGLLTTQPAAGDIFYAYMTGLGAVSGPMETGVPASLSTPAPILGSLTCQFDPQASLATTLFAGLAPGTVGIYQVAFQLPADAGPKPINCLTCTWRGSNIQGLSSGLCQRDAMPGATQ